MSRSVPWRRTCPDKVSSRIDRAARARVYLLRATGPTGFLLTAEGDDRKFKVFLGDPHSCTCPTFVKEKDLCVHILWVFIMDDLNLVQTWLLIYSSPDDVIVQQGEDMLADGQISKAIVTVFKAWSST